MAISSSSEFLQLFLNSPSDLFNKISHLLEQKMDLVPALNCRVDAESNTLLHYVVMARQLDILSLLLRAGADPDLKNSARESPLNLAALEEDLEMTCELLTKSAELTWMRWRTKLPEFSSSLTRIPDCEVCLRWAGHSKYLTMLNAVLPNDDMKITKKGSCVRLDFTFKGYKSCSIRRGCSSVLFWGADSDLPGSLWYLDHEQKAYCSAATDTYDFDPASARKEAEELIKDIKTKTDLKFDGSNMSFSPIEAKKGPGKYKTETIGGYPCVIYHLDNLVLNFEQRHRKISAMTNSIQRPNSSSSSPIRQDPDQKIRSATSESQQETLHHNAPASDGSPTQEAKGKEKEKEGTSKFKFKAKAKMWVTQEFPFTLLDLLPILEVLAPANARIRKVKDVLTTKLPEGFPIKIDIPIAMGIHAEICFSNAQKVVPDSELFEIPQEYAVKPTLLHKAPREKDSVAYDPKIVEPD